MTFFEKVYEITRHIPAGKVTTYKEIGRKMGSRAYRAIGQALRCNPDAPAIPCHRVVTCKGLIGGFKGKVKGKEIAEKVGLLTSEGVDVNGGKIDLGRFMHFFK